MEWRENPRTDKQYTALINMRRALKWKCDIPLTKGECADLISEMKNEILNRLSICGSINPRACLAVCDSDEDSEEDSSFDDIF